MAKKFKWKMFNNKILDSVPYSSDMAKLWSPNLYFGDNIAYLYQIHA